jgi:serine/threonine-protein kinase
MNTWRLGQRLEFACGSIPSERSLPAGIYKLMALQTGQLFGNYHIVRLIGEGGFGEVYLAENPLIERRAAVKVLHPALTLDTGLVRRFLNEARAVGAIRHPNIVEVYDAGRTPEGAPYILMEFLEGKSLQKRLAEVGKFPLAQVIEIASQAGSALAAAHAAGIVHRDLKPENIFLVPDASLPGGERVKILDFGIAKVSGHGNVGKTSTQSGLVMGSPTYMSPEQCKDSADVDLRADVYSFAVILYEIMTGRPPFEAPTGTELLLMHLAEAPPSLLERAPSVPAYMADAIMRALAKEREERFPDVPAFLRALKGKMDNGLRRPSPAESGEALRASRVSRVDRTMGFGASTTFSQANGEVGEKSGSQLGGARNVPRRWMVYVAGGVAGAGLALLLLARFTDDGRPQANPGAARPVGGVAPPLGSNAAPMVPGGPDGGVDAGTRPAADSAPPSTGKTARAPTARTRPSTGPRRASVPVRSNQPPSVPSNQEDVTGF